MSVQAERRNPESLLNRLERLIRTRKECPQIRAGNFRLVDTDRPKEVFSHACADGDWAILTLHNLVGRALPGVRVQPLGDAAWIDRAPGFVPERARSSGG
ncbi:MAG: hypothetical protein INR62_07150 [Rhodospirillales bacterium]|nr:hypothetical protein [Acetobacter sp.]